MPQKNIDPIIFANRIKRANDVFYVFHEHLDTICLFRQMCSIFQLPEYFIKKLKETLFSAGVKV